MSANATDGAPLGPLVATPVLLVAIGVSAMLSSIDRLLLYDSTPPMRKHRLVLALAFALALAGCTTFSERFHVPGRDPLLTFMGADWDGTAKLWPAPTLPELRPMRTELIPDRGPPPGNPPIGWPPL